MRPLSPVAFWVFFFICFVFFGFVGPWLVSMADTTAVIVGFAIAFALFYTGYKLFI